VTPSDCGVAIEHHALDCDSASAAAKMRQRGLPEGCAATLETGFWPSSDILPPAALATRGRHLDPAAVFWRDRATVS